MAKRSPLIALARMKPALSTLAQSPRPFLVEPLPHADTKRASPTTSQYAIARATVHQNIMSALPYTGSSELGWSTVVLRSRQTSSFWKGSSARRRVSKVTSEYSFPSCIELESANGPGGKGQYVPTLLLLGSGDGGRNVEQKYELLFHTENVSISVVVKSVAS